MNDESDPKAALVNPAVAAGFLHHSPTSDPADGVIASPIVRHHGDCEWCRWMTAEIRRLHHARSTWVDLSQRVARDEREIQTIAAELLHARHEIERLRGELTRRHLKAVAA